MKEELYLAEEANRLLLRLACWLILYAISLFAALAVGYGLLQGVFAFVTIRCAQKCICTALQLYRVNKTMRDINQ